MLGRGSTPCKNAKGHRETMAVRRNSGDDTMTMPDAKERVVSGYCKEFEFCLPEFGFYSKHGRGMKRL